MPSPAQTLPTAPPEHLAMDYARLRAEGLRLLGELASDQWTDFNAHDPGITILEQLCYAITDLAYRIDFPVPDLLAGPGFDASASLPSAATILGCDPVTSADLRKLALDASGADNAWVEARTSFDCEAYYHASSRALHLTPDPGAVEAGAVALRGLHQIWLPTGEDSDEAGRVASFTRLHASRPLGEDLRISLLSTQEIWLDVAIEVEASDQPDHLLAEIVAAIDSYLSPALGFEDISAAQARSAGSETLFQGPQLERGFVDDHALATTERRRVVYGSDLLHAITDVNAVRAVRDLSMAKGESGQRERWALEVDDGRIPTLAPSSRIRLLRDGRPLQRGGFSVADAIAELRTREESPILPLEARDLPVEKGRERGLERYHSILGQFPQLYGVGRFGLPASASPRRRAQARQLRAYVLIFDQLLANMFAQLAHARELFSHYGETPRTYFSQVVSDPVIDLDELRRKTPAEHSRWLATTTLATATDELGSLDRRSRFLSHLLARYAEQLDERGGRAMTEASASEQTLAFIRRKLEFLRAYPELGSARGRGVDLTTTSDRSGLTERIRLELGFTADERELVVVEHVLLRPISEDQNQRGSEGEDAVPLLVGLDQPDPYSAQLSVVCRDRRGELADDEAEAYEALVEQLVGDHCPAHLCVTLHWLGDDEHDDWTRFLGAYEDFRANYASYRNSLALSGSVDVQIQLRVRDARDRVLEVLGIGETFPLRDIPLPSSLVVPANTPAVIALAYTQPGVIYQLGDHRSGQAILGDDGEPVELIGTGAAAELLTPKILEDVDYKIRAIRRDPKQPERQRAAWLHTKVTIREGVDPNLDAVIRAPLLDSRIDQPSSTDARLISYGEPVEVEIRASQEGVRYVLIDHADHESVLSQSDVLGTGGTVVLESVAINEDLDLRIRGRKELQDGDQDAREAVLNIILPLRVRANPKVEFVAAAQVIDYDASVRVRVRGSQAGVRYRVYTRWLSDAEYLFDGPSKSELTIDAGDHSVRVARVKWRENWSRGKYFIQRDSARTGNGSTLSFDLGQLPDDVQVLARADKVHALGPLDAEPASETRGSSVELEQATAVLVRPNPAPALAAKLDASGEGIVVSGGQRGVAYTLTGVGESPTSTHPAYFHQRDDNNAQLNKGIAQLRVERDLSIIRDPESAGDLERTAPLDPLLELAGVAVGDRWQVVARKVMTDLEADVEAELEALAAD